MRRVSEALLVVLLLAAMAALLFRGARDDGWTNDEILYVASGYRQLAASDYTLNPTHPPLAASLAAVGLIGLDLRLPPLAPAEDVLDWCYRFVHLENDATALLSRARTPAIVLTLLLALVVWLWGRRLSGRLGGLVALACVAFHPSLVAHGHLAATDVPGAFATLVGVWLFWRWQMVPTVARAVLLAVSLGLGAATRHTTLLVVPVFAVLVGLALARRRGAVPGRAVVSLLLACLALVPATIWLAYGFHDAPWPVARSPLPAAPAAVARTCDAVEATHLLPSGFVSSLRFQAAHERGGHPAFLLGEHRNTGWWHYYLVALAVKNTPGFLAALALATLACVFRAFRRPVRPEPNEGERAAHAGERAARTLWIAVPLVVLVVASASRIQIGERYVLAVYPFLALWLGSVAARLPRRAGPALVVALALAHALPTWRAQDGGTISYFNFLAGGRTGGHRILLDSNLDWGQDLPRLRELMRERGIPSVQLAYQGVDDPARLGIVREDIPGRNLYSGHLPPAELRGFVAISPNLLWGLLPHVGERYAALRTLAPHARAGALVVYRASRAESDLAASVADRGLRAR